MVEGAVQLTQTVTDVDIWLHDFLQNRSVQIQEAFGLRIERFLQGSEQLTFSLPLNDPKLPFIHEDQLIFTENDYWIVDHFEDSHPGHKKIVCNARWIELSWRTRVGPFSVLGKTPGAGLADILAQSGWAVGTVPPNSDLFSMEEMDGTNLSLLRRWAAVTGYEILFNNTTRTVSFVSAVGTARDIGFSWGYNIREIKRTLHPPPATRLYPVGANNLNIAGVNPTGLQYIENFDFYTDQGLTITQARNLYRKDLIWVDQRYLLALNLYDAAVRRLEKLSKPRVFYAASVIDLSRIIGGGTIGFNPGDTMKVDDEVLGVLENVRVTRTVVYPNDPKSDEVELGFMSNGMLDVSSGGERDMEYGTLVPIVDTNNELMTIAASELNYGEISITSTGSGVIISGSTFVGTATGSGTIRFRMVINGANVGDPREIAFTNGQQIEFSWPSFATDLDEGSHDIHWRAQVFEGSGTVALATNAGRSWVLARGAIGIGISTSPSQSLSEVIEEWLSYNVEDTDLSVGFDDLIEIDIFEDMEHFEYEPEDFLNDLSYFRLNDPLYGVLDGPGWLAPPAKEYV